MAIERDDVTGDRVWKPYLDGSPEWNGVDDYDEWARAQGEREEREDRTAMEAAGQTEADIHRMLEEGNAPRPLTAFQLYVNKFSGDDPRPLATIADWQYWESEIKVAATILFGIQPEVWDRLSQNDRDAYILRMITGKTDTPAVTAPAVVEETREPPQAEERSQGGLTKKKLDVAKRFSMLVGPDSKKIWEVVIDESKTVNQRLAEIWEIDSRYLSPKYTTTWWAEVLGVSRQAIWQASLWKEKCEKEKGD